MVRLFFSALVAWLSAMATAIQAETKPTGAEQPRPAVNEFLQSPLVFYLAKGDENACGDGCSEWIAAEGRFDEGAAARLQAFLKPAGRQRLPIFFYSGGGGQTAALAIGRLLRKHGMTAGVARTIPRQCAIAGEQDESCRKLKRSGQVLAAAFRPDAVCASACVFALVGGKVRHVPASAHVGIHSGKIVWKQSDPRVKAASRQRLASVEKTRSAEYVEQARRYLREMGIDGGLLDAALKIPHEQVRYLSRDEIAGFGIDVRTFHQTGWFALEIPSQPFAIFKLVVEAKGAGGKEFRTSAVRVGCDTAPKITLNYVRGLASDQVGRWATIKFAAGNGGLTFTTPPRVVKIEMIDPATSFDLHATYATFHFLEAAAAADSLVITETDLQGTAPGRVVRLSTGGLRAGIELLRQRCTTAS